MVDETIVNTIIIDGVAKAEKDLIEFGVVGETALNRVNSAAAALPGVGQIGKDVGAGLSASAAGVGAAAKSFVTLAPAVRVTRDSLAQFIPVASQTRTVFQGIGTAFSSVIAGLTGTAVAAEAVGGASEHANNQATLFGRTLRNIGRVTGERQLSVLGRTITVLGRAFAVAAPALLAIGLGILARAGANAASALADLGAGLRLTIDQVSALKAVGSAAGLSTDQFGNSLKGVAGLIKETATAETEGAKATDQLREQLVQSREAADEASKGFSDISKKSVKLAVDLNNGKVSLDDFVSGQADLRQETRKLNNELDKQDEATRKIERSLQLANIEAINNGTALQKLGITALDSKGKLKQIPAVLAEVANALKAMPAGTDKASVEFDLIAAGIDRRLLPALRQGSAAFKQIESDSRKINPGFTNEQIDVADKFTVAVVQAESAFSALIAAMGIAIAPSFTSFFEHVTSLIVAIRPAFTNFITTLSGAAPTLQAFGSALGSVIGSALIGIGTTIQTIIIPAFQGFFAAIQLIADAINKVFGTNLTSMDLFVAALVAVSAAFGSIPVIIVAVAAAIGLVIRAWTEANDLTKAFFILAGTVIAALIVAFGSIPALIAVLVAAFGGLVAAWQAGGAQVDALKATWTDFTNTVIGYWNSIRDAIFSVWNDVKEIWANITGGGASATAQIPGFSGGGPIRGRGGPTSDSNLFWGSNGEFVQRTAAVRKYGLSFMHAINSLQFDPARFFSMGGLLPSSQPKIRFAEGGLINSGGGVLNLTIGDQIFRGLRASEETMDQLTRFSVRSQNRTSGRKPSWKR